MHACSGSWTTVVGTRLLGGIRWTTFYFVRLRACSATTCISNPY